ncbi:hypothetical protein M409DRAFT_28155 [Zasmidium cellare ATCC 36951]|uniref:GST N-terminal domain-containing protein n=1 Tax=Zasmidium cellare ATCC 36951 TaxID=1080233 RepID=A0A6A6C2U4_ZASCE|nr:uncharacterized protein M409DRAFT_28155 [Zasmidium cellare ATCC 36951]KAF2161424.1 hypothetical protein M409DRAFT_28155 [Zasmidium cellare ATCC 36951]
MPPKHPLPNNQPGEIILFNFPESVFGRRMVRYFNLRSLLYSQIRVPPNMPRPILQEKLGINYRRIPVMAIGRDIYIDTRIMLPKLEKFFPEKRLGAQSSFDAGFEAMLEEFVIDGGPFWRTAGCIPETAPFMQNEVWMKDRSDGSGGQFNKEALRENRAWSLSQLRLWFGIVEKFFADGREWILGTEGPSLSDIHAGWQCDWAINMAGDMNDEKGHESTADMRKVLSREEFPHVHAWVERFRRATDDAGNANQGAGALDEGEEAENDIVRRILASDLTEAESPGVDESDILGLKQGQRIIVALVDFGFTHKDEGILVGLAKDEVVIEVDVPGDNAKLRLHYPRINFKILPL